MRSKMDNYISGIMAEIEKLNNSDIGTTDLIEAYEEVISDLEIRVQALRDDLKRAIDEI